VSAPAGVVFDIQHYAVHDGPGIRTLVFLKGCPLRCAWCCNPESQGPQPALRRFASRCQACRRCVDVCADRALSSTGGVVAIDRSSCGPCAAMPCVPACPSQALTTVGRTMDAASVIARAAADRAFYRNSGGGVTFSGGEPFTQPGFLMAVLEACKAGGIHTAVETCGHADPEVVLAAEPLVDLFLFDLKIAGPARHRLATGVTNALILETFTALAARNPAKVHVRVPLVPGYTDDRANLEALARLAADRRVAAVQVVPYHPLGRDKYEEMGLPVPPEVLPVPPAAVDAALAVFAAHGLAADVA
jgi:pyruvate formate lyase activating enzyme